MDPKGNITRERVAAILYRYYGKSAPTTYHAGYVDVPARSWYKDPVNLGSETGIFRRMNRTDFGVGVNASRAMAVALIYRAETGNDR